MIATRGRLSRELAEESITVSRDVRADAIHALRRIGRPAVLREVQSHTRHVRRPEDLRAALDSLAGEGLVDASIRSEPIHHGSATTKEYTYYRLIGDDMSRTVFGEDEARDGPTIKARVAEVRRRKDEAAVNGHPDATIPDAELVEALDGNTKGQPVTKTQAILDACGRIKARDEPITYAAIGREIGDVDPGYQGRLSALIGKLRVRGQFPYDLIKASAGGRPRGVVATPARIDPPCSGDPTERLITTLARRVLERMAEMVEGAS